MTKFWAFTHSGNITTYAGDSWEAGGFSVDSEGNPDRDPLGNTVANWSADPIDAETDARLIRDAYAGDGAAVGDRADFEAWLRSEGFDTGEVAALVRCFADEITMVCIYCFRPIPLGKIEPVPAGDDADAWESLAADHDADCEWIATRAHRIDLETGADR